jgi:hypothetical protein
MAACRLTIRQRAAHRVECRLMNSRVRLIPRLRHRADLRTLGFVALELALLAGTWSGAWRHPLAVGASFVLAFVCCIIAHNPVHLPLIRGRGWNRVFQILRIERLRRPAANHAR